MACKGMLATLQALLIFCVVYLRALIDVVIAVLCPLAVWVVLIQRQVSLLATESNTAVDMCTYQPSTVQKSAVHATVAACTARQLQDSCGRIPGRLFACELETTALTRICVTFPSCFLIDRKLHVQELPPNCCCCSTGTCPRSWPSQCI